MKDNLKIVLIAFILLYAIPVECAENIEGVKTEKKFVIVASTFPVYLFASNICQNADNIKLELLIPSSTGCPHDFMLRPADLQKLAKANALIINGAHLEDFLSKTLQKFPSLPVINASSNIPLLTIDGSTNHTINPHTFASPAMAVLMVKNIALSLSSLNPTNTEIYKKNSEAYIKILEKLSSRLLATGMNASNKKVVIEHEAIAYLLVNAGLDIIGSFQANISASKLAQMKKFILKNDPLLLAGDSQFSNNLLKTLSAETDTPYAIFNPCAAGPENAPLDYYQTIMQNNIQTLEKYFAK